MQRVKKYSLVLFAILVFLLAGCKGKTEDCTDADYDKCNTYKPAEGLVVINLTKISESRWVDVRLYEGFIEDNKILYKDEIFSDVKKYLVPVDKYYTATVTYQKGNQTILAIDGGELKLKSYRMCEYTCYEVKDLELDLKLY